MNQLVTAFMKVFGGNFSDIVAVIVLLLAICWFINYDVLKLGRIRKGLQKISKDVEKLEGRSVDNIARLDKQVDYHLHSAFRKNWKYFYSDFKDSNGRVPDANEYFTLEKIVTIPAGRKKAETVPGLLIMIGILAAFLSIAGALPKLNLTAAGAEGKIGLEMLTGVISTAFGVCIVSILLSIVFQLIDRRYFQKAVLELDNFLNLFSRKTPVADTHSGFDAGSQVANEAAAAAFGETALTGILPAISDLNANFEKFSNESLSIQNKGVQAITEAFIDKLNITIGGQFENIASNSQKILDYQLRTDRSVFNLVDQLNQNTELQKKAYSDIFSLVEAIGTYQKQAEAINASLASGVEMMANAYEKITETAEADKTDKEAIAQERRSLQQESRLYFENMEKQVEKLMGELSMQLDSAFSRFSDISSFSIEKLDSTMKGSIDDITGNLKSLVDSLDDQARDINLYAKGLAEEVAELNERLESSAAVFSEQLNKGVTRTFDTFDSGLSEISTRFGNVISDIRDVVDELPVVMGAITDNRGSKQEKPL